MLPQRMNAIRNKENFLIRIGKLYDANTLKDKPQLAEFSDFQFARTDLLNTMRAALMSKLNTREQKGADETLVGRIGKIFSAWLKIRV
jgi:hypothetical protein